MIGSVAPPQILAYPGMYLKIYCGSYYSPVWTKEGGLAQNAIFLSNRKFLFLKGVRKSNAGVYWCHGIGDYEMYFKKKSTLYVGG